MVTKVKHRPYTSLSSWSTKKQEGIYKDSKDGNKGQASSLYFFVIIKRLINITFSSV